MASTKGSDHWNWVGGLPECEICGKKLSQYRSPSAKKRGVKKRCRDCYYLDVKSNSKKYLCSICGGERSKNAKNCKLCADKLKKGKHYSPKTEWKPGVVPQSHLRNNFGNKFNIAPKEQRTYKGVVYHSKMESCYAAYLDTLKKIGEIKDWSGQCPFDVNINGMHVTTYFCDFKVELLDDSVEYHEVKGHVTELYKIKKKLVELTLGVRIKEIKQKEMKELGIY
jgi:hypothetical protein